MAEHKYSQGNGYLPDGWYWAASSLSMPPPHPLLRAPVRAGLPESGSPKAEWQPHLPSPGANTGVGKLRRESAPSVLPVLRWRGVWRITSSVDGAVSYCLDSNCPPESYGASPAANEDAVDPTPLSDRRRIPRDRGGRP